MPRGIDNRVQSSFLEAPQKVWRPIHYLGSKLRLTDLICDLLDDLADGPVCDLFAGSGTVSLALSQSRNVLAADIQEYSRVICTAILKPAPICNQDVADLLRRADRSRSRIEAYLEPLLDYEQQALERCDARPELLCDLVDHSSLISGNAERVNDFETLAGRI
jgi:hypothetical protein